MLNYVVLRQANPDEQSLNISVAPALTFRITSPYRHHQSYPLIIYSLLYSVSLSSL